MGASDCRPAAGKLLRERATRCHGGGFTRRMRDLLRDYRRPGVWILRRWRYLGAYRSRSAGSTFGRGANARMIRVVLPAHLRKLAQVEDEITLAVERPVTQRSILDALEGSFPNLRG